MKKLTKDIEVEIFITQKDMVGDSWRWVEVHTRDGFQQDHCPFNSKEEATKAAKKSMEHFQYKYRIVITGDPPDEYPQ